MKSLDISTTKRIQVSATLNDMTGITFDSEEGFLLIEQENSVLEIDFDELLEVMSSIKKEMERV